MRIKFILLMVMSVIFVNANATNTSMQCFPDPKSAYHHLNEQAQLANKININSATEAELLALKGVGVKTAQAIVLYRQNVSRFNSVEDLTKVKGIGNKTLEKNRHLLVVY